MVLIDDGSLDTVLKCEVCGHEQRYNYYPLCDDDDDDKESYYRWVESLIEDEECYVCEF